MRRLALALVFFAFSAGAAGAAITPTRIATDPFGPGVIGQHSTIAEPDSFSVGNTVVAAFQVGRNFGGGAAAIGWATSVDGGATWRNGILPSLTPFTVPTGPFSRVSDPVVAYDRIHGVWLISILALTDTPGLGTSSLVTARSTDAVNWSAPVVTAPNVGAFLHDKNWIVCDNNAASRFAGRCYTVWTDIPTDGSLAMSTSIDGGVTWGAAVFPPASSANGNGALPLVLPSGTLVVPYRTFGAEIHSLISIDGGASLGSETVVGSSLAGVVPGFRVPPLPSGEIDASGRMFLSWHTCAFRGQCGAGIFKNDLALSTSTDGVTWTAPRRIPLAATEQRNLVLPGLGVDPTASGPAARLGLVYYAFEPPLCGFTECRVRAWYASSSDAGARWSTPVALSSPMQPEWIAQTSQGRMLGDYFSTSYVAGGVAVPVFTAALAPEGTTFHQDLYAAAVPPLAPAPALAITAGPAVVAPGRVRAGSLLRATIAVRRNDAVASIAGAKATCDARIRGRRLPLVSARVLARSVQCTWRVPRGKAATVRATVTVRLGPAVATRRFSVRP